MDMIDRSGGPRGRGASTRGALLASALTAFGFVGGSFPAFSQNATTFTLNETNSSSGTFSVTPTTLNSGVLSNPSQNLTPGNRVYNYVATTFTVAATGSYTFGQATSPSDTVMILYVGGFNPADPRTNAIAGVDDFGGARPQGVTMGQCGSLCPQLTANLTQGDVVTLVISTYGPGAQVGPFIGPALTLDSTSTKLDQTSPIIQGAPAVDIYSTGTFTVTTTPTPDTTFRNLSLTSASLGNSIAVAASGGSITAAGGTYTLSGVLSGAGALSLLGTGTITLSGVNTLNGDVSVAQGLTLALSGAGSLANADEVVLSGILDIANTTSGATLNAISGAGNVVLGARTLTLTNASGTLGGVISGTGGLTISGGHLILTGTSTYTGATTVQGGLLSVNGSIASSSVTVNNGGTLGGSGTVGGITLASGGTLAPGNSIGTLNVNGNVTLAAGSVYRVEVQNNQADKVVATGAATVASALNVTAINNEWPRPRTTLRILSAAGGVTGTFSTVTLVNAPGSVRYEITYGATDIDLMLSSVTFAEAATNRNQRAVGVALDRVAEGTLTAAQSAVMNTLYAVPEEQMPRALSELSGEVHTAAIPLATRSSGLFMQTILDPSLQGRQQAGACGETLPGQAGAAQRTHCHDAGHYTVWVAPFVGNGTISGNRAMGSSSRSEQIAGMTVGADMRIDANSMVGFALGGASAQAKISNGLGSLNSNVLMAGVYGMHNVGALSLGAAFGYSAMEAETKRSMGTVGVNRLESDYTVSTWSGRIQAAYALIQQTDFSFGPYAFAQAFNVNRPAFQETGAGGAAADLGVSSGSRSATDAQSELGLQLLDQGQIGSMPASAFIRAGWRYALAQSDDMRANITSLPTSGFTVTGAQADEHMASIGAGLDVTVAPGVSVGGRVESLIGANASFVTGSVRLRLEF